MTTHKNKKFAFISSGKIPDVESTYSKKSFNFGKGKKADEPKQNIERIIDSSASMTDEDEAPLASWEQDDDEDDFF